MEIARIKAPQSGVVETETLDSESSGLKRAQYSCQFDCHLSSGAVALLKSNRFDLAVCCTFELITNQRFVLV